MYKSKLAKDQQREYPRSMITKVDEELFNFVQQTCLEEERSVSAYLRLLIRKDYDQRKGGSNE